MTTQPWLKFYPSDWRADPALRMCGLAARGLWVEMLAIMHEAEPRGLLLINGNPLTNRQLALLVGSDESTVSELIGELESAGVFSRKKNDVIFSRRMEKDENQARKNRENGKMGGNPSLSKQTKKQQSDNPQVKAQKPEARSQKEKIEPKGSPKKTGRATRLSEEWTLPTDWRDIAIEMGMPQSQIDREALQMRDWSLSAKGGAKLDWLATWRGWVRRWLADHPQRSAPSSQAGKPATLSPDHRKRWSAEQWLGHLRIAREENHWDASKLGPPPFTERCEVPTDLLTEADRRFAKHHELQESLL